MRVKAIILISFLTLCSLVGQAQNDIFENLSARKDIQAVHVSKSLLEMIPKMETGGTDIAHLADKLKQIDVYTSETSEAAKFMKTQAEFFAKNKSYENFMTVKEKKETITFYGQKSGEKFKDLIMLVSEGEKFKIIRYIGDFTAKDIQQVMKK